VPGSHLKTSKMEVFIKQTPVAGWGTHNGYVIIPKGHKLHGIDYNDLDEKVSVHGGLTFSEEATEGMLEYWPELTEHIGDWVVGFDTMHGGDNSTRWNEHTVLQEAKMLKMQLEALELN
jgi:hypothetical protein